MYPYADPDRSFSREDRLLFCAANAVSFQELVNCASELLDATVIVADPLHYIIAISSDIPEQVRENQTWSQLIEAGLVPPIAPKPPEHACTSPPEPEEIQLGTNLRLHEAIVTKSRHLCIMGDIFTEQTLALRFAVTSLRPLTGEQQHLVVTLAFTLQLAYRKWNMNSHQDAPSLYLLDLLHNRPTTDANVLRQIHFDTQSTYRMYCFDTANLGPCNLSFIPISAVIQNTPNALSTMDGTVFVLLVSCQQDYTTLYHQLSQFALEARFPILESYTLNDIYHIPEIYQIMQAASSVAQSFRGANGIFQLSDFSMFLFFERIIKYNEGETIIHPDADFLIRYDREKKSDLAQTAYCYLLHNREAPATAEALYIHRNTLDKRLRKIETLIDAQWHSVSYQLVMLTSLYQLLKTEKKLIYYKIP